MDAALGLEQPVGVLAPDGQRRGLEAGLLARARLDELGLEPAVGRPAEVHPQQHLRPVLRIRPARAGRDRDDSVALVVLAVEERLLAQTREIVAHGRDLLRHLALELRVELDQLTSVVELVPQALVALEPPRHPRVLGRDAGGLGLVVPEPGHAHGALELRRAGCQRNGVKGSHGPSRAGPRAPRAGRRSVCPRRPS